MGEMSFNKRGKWWVPCMVSCKPGGFQASAPSCCRRHQCYTERSCPTVASTPSLAPWREFFPLPIANAIRITHGHLHAPQVVGLFFSWGITMGFNTKSWSDFGWLRGYLHDIETLHVDVEQIISTNMRSSTGNMGEIEESTVMKYNTVWISPKLWTVVDVDRLQKNPVTDGSSMHGAGHIFHATWFTGHATHQLWGLVHSYGKWMNMAHL